MLENERRALPGAANCQREMLNVSSHCVTLLVSSLEKRSQLLKRPAVRQALVRAHWWPAQS